jgi:hypothetical protein
MTTNRTSAILIFISIIIGLLLVSLTFYYSRIYESPEDCFVSKMTVWSIENEFSDKTKQLTNSDVKMAVARAEAVKKEFKANDLKGDDRTIYLQMVTLLDYCNIK